MFPFYLAYGTKLARECVCTPFGFPAPATILNGALVRVARLGSLGE